MMTDTNMEAPEPSKSNLPFAELIILLAMLMSLVALSIDAVLPALTQLGQQLGHTDPKDLQLVIISVFAGLAIGQLLYGPLSDQTGRKPALVLGLVTFVIGAIISWAAESYELFLFGRFLQGFGASGPRIVLVAMVRDLYSGRMMARVMSFVMGIFIFVPTIAPILGQWVYNLAGWRAIFLMFVLLGTLSGLWFWIRQNETLRPDRRIKVTADSLKSGSKTVFTTPSAFGYLLAAGIISGPFVSYLSTAQDLFQSTYQVGALFPYYFAGLALSIGVASFLNSRMVMKYGMRLLGRNAMIAMIVLSSAALAVGLPYGFVPPIWLFLLCFSPLFFAIGILFGNLNALAMEEVGQIAGLASALIGAISTLIAMIIAAFVGQFYDGTIFSLGASFAICGLLALITMEITERRRDSAK